MSKFDDEALLRFVTELSRRLTDGAKTYGNRSFSADPAALLNEIRQELVDVAGWAFVLTERLRTLEAALVDLPKTEPTAATVVIRRPARRPEPEPLNGKANGAAHADTKEPST